MAGTGTNSTKYSAAAEFAFRIRQKIDWPAGRGSIIAHNTAIHFPQSFSTAKWSGAVVT